jgi:tRNA A-37 threonylcarbamoyl transferase component Bud32
LDGTYRLLRRVGEGAMGVVYEAAHARLAGRYAIKVLLGNLSKDGEALARFDREARITSLLQHPNDVQVIDHNTAADGTEYLVMEYLAGESLSARLAREGCLPLEAVVRIVGQIAAGLAAAHAHGIVHRDLKPDNVFLVPVDGRAEELVKILDFGISKASWGPRPAEREVCGTPQYMAPEQFEGRTADLDGATDQFALAVIAYEMLTGRNPFQGDSLEAVFRRVAQGISPETRWGDAVNAVLARGLAVSNRRRFATVTDFSAALRAAARGGARGRVEGGIAARAAYRPTLENPRRVRRGPRRFAVAVAFLTGMSMSIFVGRTWSRSIRSRLGRGDAPARVASVSAALHARAGAEPAAADEKVAEARPPSATPAETTPEPAERRPALVPPAEVATERTPERHRRARHLGRDSSPRPPPPVSRPPSWIHDEDATMPLSY